MKVDFFVILLFLIFPRINFGQQLFDISFLGEFEYGQEIIRNGSFEDVTENTCNQTSSNLEWTIEWNYISNPVTLRQCQNSFSSRVPLSGFGFKYPKTGNNLVHLVQGYLKRIDNNQWAFNGAQVSQHIVQEFEEPLKQDSIYEFSIHLSPTQGKFPKLCTDCFQVKFYESYEEIDTPINEIGFGFSQDNPEHNFEADINFVFEVVTDTIGWIKYTTYYKAIGNEKVAVFGCFKEPDDINGMEYHNMNQLYYVYEMGWYLDDISLKSINPIKFPKFTIDCYSLPNIITPNNDGVNDRFIYQSEEDNELEFILYNRWGDLIYEEKGIQVEFPKYNLAYNDGVYFYILKNDYSTCKNSLTIKK